MSKGKRANQLWNRVAVPRRVCETKGKLKHCLRVASFSPHSSISRLATVSLYESYSQNRIRHTSLQWYVFLWTTLASCVTVLTGTNQCWNNGRNTCLDAFFFQRRWHNMTGHFLTSLDLINVLDILAIWIVILKKWQIGSVLTSYYYLNFSILGSSRLLLMEAEIALIEEDGLSTQTQ